MRKFIEEALSEQQIISDIVIDQRYDIILPEYNGMKIRLRPLEKTIYFLYLRHPEGIAFMVLVDHEQELCEIYARVTNRENLDEGSKSVKRLIDPFDNSINIQRSRISRAIKDAFESQFDPELTKHYVISGERGQLMKIDIPREKVTWLCKL